MKDPISEPVKRFILLYVDSVELLHVLLLLQKDPERHFQVEEIERELRSSHSSIQKRLEDLYRYKILQRLDESDRHCYVPINNEMKGILEALAHDYHVYPTRIIELIFSKQKEALFDFADAFRIKKDDES